jgi:hypothetical protein
MRFIPIAFSAYPFLRAIGFSSKNGRFFYHFNGSKHSFTDSDQPTPNPTSAPSQENCATNRQLLSHT